MMLNDMNVEKMEARSYLKQAIDQLQESHGKGNGVEGAIRGFARCHWVSLRESDTEGCYWSAKLVQGILAVGLSQEDPKELFERLLQIFEAENTGDVAREESDHVAIAAFHVGALQRCDAQDAEMWLRTCLENIKPGSYLHNLACLELGKLLLVQASRQDDALKWFEAAKHGATSKHLAILASYYLGKTLSKLERYEDASASLKNDKLMDEQQYLLTSALGTMLDADVQLGRRAALEQVLRTYEDARILLQAGKFLPSLERKLMEYMGSSCPCLLLMQYLRLDQFTRLAIMTDAREGPGVPIEVCFNAWELYREARCKMLELQEEHGRYFYLDPKPHLERGVEYMYSTRKDSELVPRALDSLVISQQISSKAGNLSGLYWAGVFLDDYIGSGYEDTSSRIFSCFNESSMDEEAPEAWANYYLGRAGAENGLVTKSQHELLKISLGKTTGHLLGYHVAYALGNAAGMDFSIQSMMAERMKNFALGTNNPELIISAMLELFQILILNQKIERAQRVHSELVQLMSSRSGPVSELGKGVIQFLEGMKLDRCFDHIPASQSFERAIEILEPLWRIQGRGSLGSYLGTRNECLSHQSKMLLEVTYMNALTQSGSDPPVRQTPAVSSGDASNGTPVGAPSDQYLYMMYDRKKQMFANLKTRVQELVIKNENLEQEDEAAQSLLEELQSEANTSCLLPHEIASFSWSLLISRAKIAVKLFQRLQERSEEEQLTVIDDVGKIMTKAIDAAGRCITSGPMQMISTVFHGLLLADLGRNTLAIEKLEVGLRSFMALDLDLGEVSSARISYVDGMKNHFRLLQKCLNEEGEVQRALIWSEREHTRDFIHRRNLRAAGFDSDDDRAWAEIRSISESCGSDTVILVMSHQNALPSDGSYLLLSYLLYNGEIVGHRLVAETLISVTDLLNLIYTSRDQEKQHEELRRFHEALIAPFEREFQEIQPRRIIFAPSQELALVPYSALMDEDEFLIEKYSLSIVPSLRLLEHCTRRIHELASEKPDSLTALVVGNPKSPGFVNLPDAMKEASEVSAALQEVGFTAVRQLHQGEPTKDATLSLLPNCSWIHLACHCDLSDRCPEGALILAAAQQDDDPESFSLTSQEIADKCRLRASAAILSACNSGIGKRVQSAEGILALPRSFHLAGVPTVVMSLWTVGDEATKHLMRMLYSGLAAGKDLGDALQGAIVDVINENDFGNTEIKEWAAFIVSGSPFTTLKP